MKEKKPRWSIPKDWVGETAVIIGGGPSLRKEDVEIAKGKGWRRVACNNSFLIDSEADVLCWGDRRWYEWNRHELSYHKGPYKIAWQDAERTEGYKFHVLRYAEQKPELRQVLQDMSRYEEGSKDLRRALGQALQHPGSLLAEEPTTIAATNTGQGAINIAYHFGAKRIVLLGFDMREVKIDGKRRLQWHNFHKRPTEVQRYKDIFAPSIRIQFEILKTKGIELLNCTPESHLRGVPIVPLWSL